MMGKDPYKTRDEIIKMLVGGSRKVRVKKKDRK